MRTSFASSLTSVPCAVLLLALGCGDASTPKPDATAGSSEKASADGADPSAAPVVPPPDVPLDPSDDGGKLDGEVEGDDGDAEDSWEAPAGEEGDDSADAGAEGGDEPEELPPATTAYPGPCKIDWSTGSKLTFDYKGEGGTVRADVDGDGKVDTCGTFTIVGGRTTAVTIDEGCNDSIESTIEPSYDEKSNVATASFKEKSGDKEIDRDVTLIEVAGFTGLTPGYPIYAKRKDAKVYVRQGLARSVNVKKPWEGPAMKVTFGYDGKNRLLRVKEDHGSDGSTDRRFDYRYDDMGNITAMSVTLGSGDAVQKGRAKLDYSCHE